MTPMTLQLSKPVDFDDRVRSRIIAMVCTNPPSGVDRWTLDLIVDEAQKRGLIEGTISREQVRIILKQHIIWDENFQGSHSTSQPCKFYD